MKRLVATTIVAAGLALGTSAQAQDWSGGYVGAYGGSAYTMTSPMVGVIAGYSMQSGSFVYGGEVDAFYTSLGDWEVFAKGRLGYAIADPVLIHATAGLGTFNGTTTLWSLGLGGEIKLTDNLSLRGDGELHNTIGSGLTGSAPFLKAGLVWRF